MMKQLCCFLLFTGLAGAQVFEAGLQGGVSRLSNKDIGTYSGFPTQLDDGWRLGFRMTLNNWRFMGHEFGYHYSRTSLVFLGTDGSAQKYGTSIHQGFYDFLVYATPEGSPVRPFVAGGGQFSNFIFPGLSVTQGGGSTKFGYNYGGGIKLRVSPMFLIRMDFRQYVSGKPFDLPDQTGHIRQTEVSAGLSFVM